MSVTKHEIELADGSIKSVEHRSHPSSIIMAFGAASAMMLTALAYGGVLGGSGQDVILDGEGNSILVNTNPPPEIGDSVEHFINFSNGYLDGGKLTANVGGWNDTRIVVGDNPGNLGFPVALDSVVEMTYAGTTSATASTNFTMDTVVVGATRRYRWYFRNSLPDTANIGIRDHGFESNIGVIQWFSAYEEGSSSTFLFEVGTLVGGEVEYGVTIAKDTVWRFELGITVESDSTYTIDAQLFDDASSTTVPVYTSANFVKGVDTLSNDILSYDNINQLTREMDFGSSGQAGATYTGAGFYFGAWATRIGIDVIGPYPSTGEG